jgi:hypothetical protein
MDRSLALCYVLSNSHIYLPAIIPSGPKLLPVLKVKLPDQRVGRFTLIARGIEKKAPEERAVG